MFKFLNNKLGKLFYGYNIDDSFDEEEYIQDIEQHNNKIIKENSATKSKEVIQYLNNGSMYKVCNFNGDILPEKNAIIWAPDRARKTLVPYRVIRIDYLEDDEQHAEIVHRTLIVVKPSVYEDIL